MTLDQYLSQRGIFAKEFAEKLALPSPALSQYRIGRRRIPDALCPAIEFASGGLVRVEEQRPDLTWIRIPDPKWPHPHGRPLIDHSVPWPLITEDVGS